MLVEVLAKLPGLVVVLWAALSGGGPLQGRSPWKQLAVVRSYAPRLQDQLGRAEGPRGVPGQLERELGRIQRQPRRHGQPSTRQLLLDPSLAA